MIKLQFITQFYALISIPPQVLDIIATQNISPYFKGDRFSNPSCWVSFVDGPLDGHVLKLFDCHLLLLTFSGQSTWLCEALSLEEDTHGSQRSLHTFELFESWLVDFLEMGFTITWVRKPGSLRCQPQPPADVDDDVNLPKHHGKHVWTHGQSCDQPPHSTAGGCRARTEMSVTWCCYVLLYYCWNKSLTSWIFTTSTGATAAGCHFHPGARLTFTRARSVT